MPFGSTARVLLAASLTMAASAIEIAVARIDGSLFLAADAGHLLAHLGIFVVLLVHARHEALAVRLVLAIVLAVAVAITSAAVRALLHPTVPPPAGALLVSILGLGANLGTAWLFRGFGRTHLSFRVAIVHELSDGALTIIAFFGAAAIALFRWRWVDPALSLAVGVSLLAWAGRRLLGGASAAAAA